MKKKAAIILLLAMLTIRAGAFSDAKPWTFWYWMYGAVSKDGIKADLQAMHDVGLGGCYLMPIRGTSERPEYGGDAQQLTPRFWEMIDYALAQADSLGLKLGIHICDGFALAGGPWITPAEPMQKVVWTDTVITCTDKQQTFKLPQAHLGYDGYYEDIAVFAVPYYKPLPAPKVSGTIPQEEKGGFRSKEPGYIDYSFDEPQTVRSLFVMPSGNNVQAERLLVEASDDGKTFRTVKQLVPPRQGWQNTDYGYTFSLPETTARHFRFRWTPEGTEPGSEDLDAAKWAPTLKIKTLTLSAQPRIDQYEGKSGAVWRRSLTPDPSPKREGRFNPIRLYPNKNGEFETPLSLRNGAGGEALILRFGHTSTGHTNATAGGGKGLECDKFSTAAVEKQINNWFGRFMQRPNHQAIKYMHVDSWECGSQNWSKNFADEFQRRRGYDLLPYLPVYAGIPMDNAEQVLHDIRLTIDELTGDAFFATAAREARRYGVQLSSESVAPTMMSDGLSHYKYVDIPMGEYWLNSPTHDKPNDMLDAISGAHIYGKQLVQAEGFTEVRGVWNETPAMVKPLLDRNFCLGMNRLFFHVFTHNPWLDKKPGMTLDGIGLFFQRDQTWFPEAKAFVDYITRCQTLLQQGQPVTDIAVFTGEEMPSRALTPDRLVPMLPGLFGQERVASEQKRLANVGCPMEESPVGVRHSAGILDLKDWTNALHGYHYDSMNKDALLHRPFPYKALVIPTGTLVSAEAQARIDELRRQGVLIIDQPYTKATLDGTPQDAILPAGIAFVHRQDTGRDVYFLSNQTDREQMFTPQFRSQHSAATVYHPIDDTTTAYDGTIVLPPYGSCFVCFGSAAGTKTAATGSHRQTLKLQTPTWDVIFRESGVTLKKQALFDWRQHQDDRIRYFSGHARYTTTFKLPRQQGTVKLALGRVCDVAHVWVNGQDCGIAWTAPYELDITKALKKGKNVLEIEVVNTWHNALRGMDQGKLPYEGIWTNARYRSKGDDLLPAGLLTQPELVIEN